MKRRAFILLLGGATSLLSPHAAQAQQAKRVGVLMLGNASEPEWQLRLATFVDGLRKLGWIADQNLQIEVRWTSGDPTLIQPYATELVGSFKPNALFTSGTPNLMALQRATSTIPIVFTNVTDPVAQGFVPNLTNPGGNITGFANTEFSVAGRWADLLKQMAPWIRRIAVVYNPEISPQSRLFQKAIEAVAPSIGVEVLSQGVRNTADIEPTIAGLGREGNVGLVFSPDSFTRLRSRLVVEVVARHRLPAIYADDGFMAEGALMSYFNDASEGYRQAPYYIDRILKGVRPGDLPVHLPTKYRFIVNRKTANGLGIEVPLGLLIAADEVIE